MPHFPRIILILSLPKAMDLNSGENSWVGSSFSHNNKIEDS